MIEILWPLKSLNRSLPIGGWPQTRDGRKTTGMGGLSHPGKYGMVRGSYKAAFKLQG
jgi:hypothetical protein